MFGDQELCERRGGRHGLHVSNSPYGFCGRQATLNSNRGVFGDQELCERRGGRHGLHVSNSPYGFCGRQATLNSNRGVFGDQELCERRGGRPAPGGVTMGIYIRLTTCRCYYGSIHMTGYLEVLLWEYTRD